MNIFRGICVTEMQNANVIIYIISYWINVNVNHMGKGLVIYCLVLKFIFKKRQKI